MLTINKAVLKNLAVYNQARNVKAYNRIIENCFEKYDTNSFSEEGLNLLSLFIKTSSFPNVNSIDIFYKKGFILQEKILNEECMFNYINSVLTNKQISREHYFEQSEVEPHKRLEKYSQIAGKYKEVFLNRYGDEKNIENLNQCSLLDLLFARIVKCKNGNFAGYVSEVCTFLEKLSERGSRLISEDEFNDPINIKNFCLNFSINKTNIDYQDIYYLSPYELKKEFMSDSSYQDIRNEYEQLQICVQKLILDKKISYKSPERSSVRL